MQFRVREIWVCDMTPRVYESLRSHDMVRCPVPAMEDGPLTLVSMVRCPVPAMEDSPLTLVSIPTSSPLPFTNSPSQPL